MATSCTFPPDVQLPAAYRKTDFKLETRPGAATVYKCQSNRSLAQYEAGGALIWIINPSVICKDTTKKLEFGDASRAMPAPLAYSCAEFVNPSTSVEFCDIQYLTTGGTVTGSVEKGATLNVCPPNLAMQLKDGTVVKSFSCDGGSTNFQSILEDGSNKASTGRLAVTCKPHAETTTTSTTATTTAEPTTTTATSLATTTTKQETNAAPTPSQLWDVMYYYNFGLGLHAFCADQSCIDAILSNGIFGGYDLGPTWRGRVGRAISESAIEAVRNTCTAELRNLAFTKVAFHYEHNLNGDGLRQGWVATSEGACGATVPVKKWKSKVNDDMMYAVNLEGNSWYSGMAQDGGRVQFWMWQ